MCITVPSAVFSHSQPIGAAVAAGQQLAVNAAAQLVPAVSGNVIVAIAQSGNANAGDYIAVLLTPGGAVHA